MAHHDAPAGGAAALDRGGALAQRADLVHLAQQSVAGALTGGSVDPLDVRHQQVVSDELHVVAETCAERLPAGPVVFRQTVLDTDDRVLCTPVRPEVDQLAAVEFAALDRQAVAAARLVVELAGRGIEGDPDVLAGAATGRLDGLQDDLDGTLVAAQGRRETALVADRDGEAAVVEDRAQPVVDLDAPAQALGERAGAGGHDHELLEVGRAGRVLAAVQDVEHRHRQGARIVAAERGVERQADGGRGGVSGGETDAEHGVGAQPALVRRAVERHEHAVELPLVGGVEAPRRRGDLAVHVADGCGGALAAVAPGVAGRAVRPPRAGRCWRRWGRWRGRGRRLRGATSTSTVGLPRLSSTSRPQRFAILVVVPVIRSRFGVG